MALTKERIGEIARLFFQVKMEQTGAIKLNPAEIKRDVINTAKRFDLPLEDVVDFYELIITEAYEKTKAALGLLRCGATKE